MEPKFLSQVMVAPAPGEDCHDQSNDQRTADAHLLWGVHRERHLCGEAEHRGLLATARPAERYQSCRCNGSGAAMTRGATLLRIRLTERCLPMPAGAPYDCAPAVEISEAAT